MSFTHLGLSNELQETVKSLGYEQPTPIQRQAIPKILDKRDLIAIAQTGTGKTAAFSLPLLQNLITTDRAVEMVPRALILTPTRELALQVFNDVVAYAKDTELTSIVLHGGVSYVPQIEKLDAGVDIIIATPGRLRDLMHQKKVKLFNLEILILDEADRMLDMGFSDDVGVIISKMAKQRQTLLFSATFSDEVRKLSQQYLNKPLSISANPENVTAQNVTHRAYAVDVDRKLDLLFEIIHQHLDEQILIFARTKIKVDDVAADLIDRGLLVMATHGDRTQAHRTKAMARFMEGKIKILVATDIAARGLDTSDLGIVINYELPNLAEDYVHRIGRTGRAGKSGLAISIITQNEVRYLAAAEQLIKFKIPILEFPGFKPKQFDMQKGTSGPSKKKKRRFHTGTTPKTTGAPSKGSASGKPSGRRKSSAPSSRPSQPARGKSTGRPKNKSR